MSSEHRVTRHIWLQNTPSGTRASNILTGRSLLLSPEELQELEEFCQGKSTDPEVAYHRHLKEADLLVESNAHPLSSPRFESVDKTLLKYLSDQMEKGPRRVRETFATPLSRLEETLRLCFASINSTAGLTIQEKAAVKWELGVLGDHVRLFFELEEGVQEEFCFSSGFLSSTVGRPLPREDYEQQPCLPETSQRRLELAQTFLSPESRGLVLGDDDLLSIYWSQNFEQECSVFELDDALLEYLPPYLSNKVSLHARDLTRGLPEEFRGRFQIILTDPMYERSGMDLFMKCCCQGLAEGGYVLFTTRPDMIEDGELLEERMAEAGLRVEQHIKNFSRYRLPNFYRQKLVSGFHGCGVSSQLIQGLSQIPYLYADMFVLRSAN